MTFIIGGVKNRKYICRVINKESQKNVKNLSNKIKAVFLTIVLLLSSSFILIDSHYCCGVKMGTTLFGKAKDCGMLTKACTLDPTKLSFSEDSCCESSLQFKKGSEFNTLSRLNINFQQLNFTPTFYNTTFTFLKTHITNTINYKNYTPPLIPKDILILVQNFRI